MSKKQLLLIIAVGVVTFGGSFVFSFLTTEPQAAVAEQPDDFYDVPERADIGRPANVQEQALAVVGLERGTTERQLSSLIADLQAKIGQYEQQLSELEAEKQRFRQTQESLQDDIEYLRQLRAQLAESMAELNRQREDLEQSRIVVRRQEQENLRAVAQTYDRMEARSASKIFINMAQMREISPEAGKESFEDVVKILHYMTERTKAQVLAQIVDSEPNLAAEISTKLKRVEQVD